MQSDIVSAAKWFGLCLVAASLILAAGINIAVLQHGSPTISTVKLQMDSIPDVRLRAVPGADSITVRLNYYDVTPKK